MHFFLNEFSPTSALIIPKIFVFAESLPIVWGQLQCAAKAVWEQRQKEAKITNENAHQNLHGDGNLQQTLMSYYSECHACRRGEFH